MCTVMCEQKTKGRSALRVVSEARFYRREACFFAHTLLTTGLEEVDFIPRDRMDMIARYLEHQAKMATI